MSDFIIIFRNTGNNAVGFVSKEDGEIEVFHDQDEAEDAAGEIPICRAFPYEVIELNV